MELRFGLLIMECNLRMGILRMRCSILVGRIHFIMSVFFFLDWERYHDANFFFFPFACSLLPVSIPSFQKSLPISLFSFPAPPGNQSAFHQWTVGAIYYSAIVLAEAFGTTNTSQIIDLGANGANNLTPAYAIYEIGLLSKVALINFMDDGQTGANNIHVTVQVPNGAPQSVQVKYVDSFFLLVIG